MFDFVLDSEILCNNFGDDGGGGGINKEGVLAVLRREPNIRVGLCFFINLTAYL